MNISNCFNFNLRSTVKWALNHPKTSIGIAASVISLASCETLRDVTLKVALVWGANIAAVVIVGGTATVITYYRMPREVNQPTVLDNDQAKILMIAAEKFNNTQNIVVEGTGHLQYLQENGTKFFGIHKSFQNDVDFASIKSKLLKKIGIGSNAPVVQVIGDSAKFSEDGTAYARKFLDHHLGLNENALILWGFTGNANEKNTSADINGLVNEWLDAHPERAKRALANVVVYGDSTEKVADTPTVMQKYNAKGAASTQNYFIVYGGAQFGDDVESSDQITDKAICFDGGAQSWCQIVNVLSHNGQVRGIFGLRGENNPLCFVASMQQYVNLFSASEFLYLLKEEIGDKVVEKEFINTFKEKYFNDRFWFNPDRYDAHTKQALADSSWEKFIKEKLWEKLGNCQIEKLDTSKTC